MIWLILWLIAVALVLLFLSGGTGKPTPRP